MPRVAIVGCGKIADAHAEMISRIEGAQIVAVCDRELLMARQLAERFSVPQAFTDLDDLVAQAKPEVVHITTPPQGHFPLARRALELGCHVYVEKPITETTAQAEELLALATQRGLLVTVGNDAQFTDAACRCRELIRSGYLGGAPVHMESHYCYEMSGSYAEALMGDKDHWVRRLPGKLLHNIISHGIVRISEHLQDDDPVVLAHGFSSPMLRGLGESEILDELRVIIVDRAGPSAYFTFSSQMRPSLHQFRIFGPKNGIQLDDDDHSVLRLRGERHKSYLQKVAPHASLAAQHIGNLSRNVSLFLRRQFHMKAGMERLIGAFYVAIAQGRPPPVPYREILLTCRVMDRIFSQIHAANTPALFPRK